MSNFRTSTAGADVDITAQLAIANAEVASPFGALLAETLLEMESAEALMLSGPDAVERLSLEAQRTISSQTGGPLPRVGGHAYLKSTVTPLANPHPQLDVRY